MSRMEDLAMSGGLGEANPLKSDDQLVALLKKLVLVKKYKTFQGWKSKFLSRLESFLYEAGMRPAQTKCDDFDKRLTKFVKAANKVQQHIEKGELSQTKKSVKASTSLSEMCKELTSVISDTEHLIPANAKDEKKAGFTKFHLGAALIRQGFHQYITMKAIEDALGVIGSTLGDVADKQQHELFEAYKVQLQRFCDVMSDLGLYEVMLKCREFAEDPGDESEDPVTISITIETDDGKTLTLELDPSETIGNIKEAIAPGAEIPIERQILTFNGNELQNPKKSLEDLGIDDGARLYLGRQKVPITVRTYDGKEISLYVNPADYLSDIKVELEREAGVPARNQKLSMNGQELADDNMRAKEYGIVGGEILDLEPKTMNITVETPDGQKHEIAVKPSDTTEDLKNKIASTTGMSVPQQVLKHNGQTLPDGKTIKDMGIRDGSEIKVEVLKVPVTVNTMDGKQIKVMVDPTDYLSDLKVQLEGESGVPARNQRLYMGGKELADDNKKAGDYGIKGGSVLDLEPKSMSITVETPDGNKHQVEITPSDTTQQLKEKIAGVTGMAPPQQVLKFQGKTLPDGKTAKDMGIQDGSEIKAEYFQVPVTVNTMDGRQIKVMVDPSKKLRDLKVQLEDESGIPAGNQKLFMNGEELADDNKTAGEHGIKAGSELDLEPKKIKVSVKTPDGRKHEIEVAPSDSTEKIKEKIAAKTGLTVPQQVVKHNGKTLPDGKTAKDMGIQEGSELDVDIYKVPVTVNLMDGRKIQVMVDPTNKLRDIKAGLEDESGLPASNQKLFMNGQELPDDNKTAGDYGIKGGSELDLEPKSMKITVESPDGNKHVVDVKPSDTTETLKQKIAKETGLAAPRQVVKFNGKECPKGKTLKDMGMNDGSAVKVEIKKIPITVRTMDGNKMKVMVEPSSTIGDIKKQLEDESGVPSKNQRLFMNGQELSDGKTADESGIKSGSELDLEPKTIKVSVKTPDGNTHSVEIAPSDTKDQVKEKIAKETGIAAPRQVVKFNGKEIPNGLKVRDTGIHDGSELNVDLYKIPIKVTTFDGKTLDLNIEPCDKIDNIKKMLQPETGLQPKQQQLKFGEEDLTNGQSTAEEYGIGKNDVLHLEKITDSIIFVDIKCGTLFGLERDEVIQRGILTTRDGNKLDFVEAANSGGMRDHLLSAMMTSKTLGVNPQVVVLSTEVEDIDLAEAEAVKSKWGVSLKKRERNKKGEEFIFVDPKTGAAGELSRVNVINSGFITIVPSKKGGETLQEAETDSLKYDKYIMDIRHVFNVKSAK